MKIFAVINQKGGTGKTTLTVNLSSQLAQHGKRVLVVDIDPQGNATSASGIDKRRLQKGAYQVLQGACELSDALLCSRLSGYHLLGANMRLAGAEVEVLADDAWREALHRSLQTVQGQFDFIFIDCPPSLSVLTVNALVAADMVLIPMQCEYFALEGLSDLADTVRRLRDGWNPKLRIAGIVRSIFDSRNTLSREVSDELSAHFGDKVFKTVIPRNVRIAEAPSHQVSVAHYAPSSNGAHSYRCLGNEFLEKFG